jgi:hypothetical protein
MSVRTALLWLVACNITGFTLGMLLHMWGL